MNFALQVVVNVGSVVDFALAPGGTDWADGTAFTVQISGSDADYVSNVVAGNFVGIDATGTAPLPNLEQGVKIANDSHNLVGTNGDGVSDALERNVISANGRVGVHFGSGAHTNTVAGNYIGTDASGGFALGNGRCGSPMWRETRQLRIPRCRC